MRGLVRVTRSASRDGVASNPVASGAGSTTCGRCPRRVEGQDHQRGPDQGTHQQMRGPESGGQKPQHHGGRYPDLQHRDATTSATDRRSSRLAGSDATAQTHGQDQDDGQKSEGERPMGPGQEGQVVAGREYARCRVESPGKAGRRGSWPPGPRTGLRRSPGPPSPAPEPWAACASAPVPGAAMATRRRGSGTGTQRSQQDHPQQHHRVCQVGDDHPGRKRQLDRHRAQQHLDHEEDQAAWLGS